MEWKKIKKNKLVIMDNITNDDKLFINKKEDLMNISSEQVKKIKYIYLNNLKIDGDFSDEWYNLFNNVVFDEVSFDNCNFIEYCGNYIFNALTVYKLSVRNCNLTVNVVDYIFNVDPYKLNDLDLSGNPFYYNSKELAEIFNRRIIYRFSLNTINLNNTGLDPFFLQMLDKRFFNSVRSIKMEQNNYLNCLSSSNIILPYMEENGLQFKTIIIPPILNKYQGISEVEILKDRLFEISKLGMKNPKKLFFFTFMHYKKL